MTAGKRTTILQIIPRLDTGGAELSTIEMTDAIVRAGGTALVVTDGGRVAHRITELGGEIVPMRAQSKNPLTLVRNASRIAALIRERGVDLVHARSRAPAWSGLMAARRTGRPFVTTYHGAYGERGRLKRLYNSVMARGDAVIANSQFTADLIRQRYGTPPQKLAVIPRGVDIARFDAGSIGQERMESLRARWGVEPDRPVIVQAARLTEWKGQTVLIEAAGLLKARGRLGRAVVILAGDAQGRDGYAARLAEQIARLDLGDSVRVVGHVEDIPAAYATALVSVVASIQPEAFGRVAAEALAAGCPVIATDIGAPPEIVSAGSRGAAGPRTGWLVPPGDAAALADALEAALSMPAANRAAMSLAAARVMAERFTAQAMQHRTLAVYDRLLGTQLEARFLVNQGADGATTQI